jgi:wobble nucleotide-excising tRNase
LVKKINRIKHFGIFQDFTASIDLVDFPTFNLLYGWNGSGKTTLSKLFHLLETKTADPEFPEFEIELLSADGTVTRQNSLSSFTDRVFVFNQPFVEENIDWKKQGAKSIVVISEDNIDDRNTYFDIKDKQLPAKRQLYAERERQYNASEKEKEDFLTTMARSLKHSLQLIDTKDSRYLNYDKGKLRKFIDDNKAVLKAGLTPLTPEELDQLRKKIRPIQKPIIDFSFPELAKKQWVEAEKRVNELLQSSVVGESIERLKQHADLNGWVQQGLELQKIYGSEICEFCGSEMPRHRISTLEKHFSAAYTSLINLLTEASKWLQNQHLSDTPPESTLFFEEFQPDYATVASELISSTGRFEAYLTHLDTALAQKLTSPFDSSHSLFAEAENRWVMSPTRARRCSPLLKDTMKNQLIFNRRWLREKPPLNFTTWRKPYRKRNTSTLRPGLMKKNYPKRRPQLRPPAFRGN